MVYLIIRHAKAADDDQQCALCRKFLESNSFRLLCLACTYAGEPLEVIDLNVDPRAEKFYKLFPLGDLRLPAILHGRKKIQRVDALHPYSLLSMLFGDVSQFGLLDVKEAEKTVKQVIKPSSLEMKVLMLVKQGFSADEIAKKLRISKKRVQELIEKIKSRKG